MTARALKFSALSALAALCLAAPAAEEQRNAAAQLAERAADARAESRAALEELNAQRDYIASERARLSAAMAELERETAELRAALAAEQGSGAARAAHRAELDSAIEALKEELAFCAAALSDYRRAMETRAEPAESLWMRAELAEIDALFAESLEPDAQAEFARRLLALAGRRNGLRLYAVPFAASCIAPDGFELSGSFVYFGPCGYFADAAGAAAGYVVARPASAMPAVLTISSPRSKAAVAALLSGRPAVVPVDVTGGEALRAKAGREPLLEHLLSGGPVMIPIVLVGIIAFVVMLRKAVELRRLRLPRPETAQMLLELARAGDSEAARRRALELGAPLGNILAEGLSLRGADREYLEESMLERLTASVPAMERGMGILAACAGVAPLLGLLGTVTGMIHTFQLVRIFGSGGARLLASGISEALVTTEAGLVIAIPALLAHAYFARKTRAAIAAMETAILAFAEGAASDAAPAGGGR